MERNIKREITAIQNKFDEMVQECENQKEMKAEQFLEYLDRVRCCFSFCGEHGLYSIKYENNGYMLIALDLKAFEKIFGRCDI